MAFKIKDGVKIGLVDVFNSSGELLVNAPTATKLLNSRTISLSGDATGSASFDGSANADIEVTIAGFDSSGGTPVLTGDIVGDVYASNATSKILENGSNGTDATFRGNLLATDGTTVVLTVGDGITIPQFEGNANSADTADQWDNARTVTFATGDVTGSFSIDGSADVSDVDLTISAGVVENTMLVNDHFTLATNGTGANFDIQLGDTWNFNEGEGIDVTIGTDTITISAEDASDTNKGIASFLADDFNVTTGAVELEDTVVKGLTVDAGATVTPTGHSVQITGGEGIDVTAAGAIITVAGEDATTTNKGIASFSTDNFLVTDGAVSIKDGGVSNAELVNSSVTIGTTEISLGATSTTLAGLTQIDIDNIRIDGNTISTTDVDGNLIIDPNGAGVINVSSTKITNLATPTENTDAATKEYVDTIASASLHYHDPVRVETPSSEGSLDAAYNNGTNGVGATLTANNNEVLVIDGITLDLNDRVLVYNQTNAAHNGIYEVTTLGVAGTTPWVLTRTTDADSYAPSDPDALGLGDAFFVTDGNTGSGELYVMTTEGSITFGTTGIIFSQIGSSQIYIAGDALSLDGVTFNVNVDDTTIEVFGDALRVKDAGISEAKLAANSVTTTKIADANVTNAKLANSTITVASDSGSNAIDLGDTLTVTGTDPVQTSVAGDTLTISVDDATTTTKGIASFLGDDFNVTAGAVELEDTVLKAITTDSGSLTIASHAISVLGGEGIDVTHTGTTITVAGELATSSNPGIASFSTDNFAVDVSGNVTIKDNGIILGTETTGNYVESVAAGTSGADTSSSGLTITGTGEGAAVTIAHADTSSITDLTATANTFVDALTFDTYGHVKTLSTSAIDFNVADNYAFKTITVAGQNNIVADSSTDTLTVVAGANISITTDDTTDTITINALSSTEGDDAFDNITDTVATVTPTVIDSFAIATYRSAKYYIQISQGTDYQISELMVIHDGTTTYDTEFAVLETAGELGTLTTAINGANLELSVTMASATNATIFIKRLLVEV